MDTSPTDDELDALDRGVDPRDILQRRAAARLERDRAVGDLRATMTDEDVLDAFGIDLTQLDR